MFMGLHARERVMRATSAHGALCCVADRLPSVRCSTELHLANHRQPAKGVSRGPALAHNLRLLRVTHEDVVAKHGASIAFAADSGAGEGQKSGQGQCIAQVFVDADVGGLLGAGVSPRLFGGGANSVRWRAHRRQLLSL